MWDAACRWTGLRSGRLRTDNVILDDCSSVGFLTSVLESDCEFFDILRGFSDPVFLSCLNPLSLVPLTSVLLTLEPVLDLFLRLVSKVLFVFLSFFLVYLFSFALISFLNSFSFCNSYFKLSSEDDASSFTTTGSS